ncbi:MAG: polymer-forming cytoskeletal protein [Tissierellaceae bacterium]
MFKKISVEKPAVENIDSLIGENIKIIGKIEGTGNLRVDGTIDGDIDYNGNIVVGETGKINGDISAGDISLAGTIHGNISSNSKAVILPTGKLIGNVQVPSFVIHENAIFEGNCKMINDKVVELDSKDRKNNKEKAK